MHEIYTTISGRVLNEPRMNHTNGYGEVLTFRVGCFSRRQGGDGQWVDGPSLYLDVTCWRKAAVAASAVIRRGSMIVAHGRLQTNEYQGSDGNRHQNLELTAYSLGLDLARQPMHGQAERPAPPPEDNAWGDAAPDEGTTVTQVAPVAPVAQEWAGRQESEPAVSA